jgi:hypothetical protein
MQASIHAIYGQENQWRETILFGHCSKGIPGLEIIGLGTKGKLIKEKIIFISQRRELKIPLKRYTLCAEINDFDNREDYFWLELPLLLLYWHLAGVTQINKLDNCVTMGKVSIHFKILQNNSAFHWIKNKNSFLMPIGQELDIERQIPVNEILPTIN